METVAKNELEAAASSVDVAEGKGTAGKCAWEESEQEISAHIGTKGIMHRANLLPSKVILLQDMPVSAQTRMSNWYAAGNQRRRNGQTRRENE